jgi:dTDP-4-dehydrorhamnose reductase
LKKLLIIGKGFLGNSLSKLAIKKFDVFEASLKHGLFVDIQKIQSIEKLIKKHDPDIIINCAAITNIEKTENDTQKLFLVNAQGPGNIAKIAKKYSKKFIHISTDSVFDGNKKKYNELDLPNPLNEYSKSKFQGEQLVLENNSNSIIVRTNFYGYDENGKFLFNWIINQLNNKKSIIGFEDIIFNPLEINNLSELLLELCLIEFKGIIHLAGDEIFSKFDFIEKIALSLNLDRKLVIRGNSDQIKLIAKRPKNTTLDNSISKKILSTKIKKLNEILSENYDEYKKIERGRP